MIDIEKTLYSAHTHTTGGREGTGRSQDGRLDLKLSPPGAPGSGTNPEQLFAVCWSACFLGSLRHACNARKIGFPATAGVDAQIDLVHGEQGFFLQARLAVSLPEIEPEVAQQLIDAAHQNCPYSKATRNNIKVSITLA
ncbi:MULTISPECIES: organic hydroperoxide resistance protein [Pseudomonas]|uniref:organic hydroperoxide resistance protein n=1 Tax=Pseudomonas TaxID=286 RepID=UPI000A1DC0A2|nr:MULTISPECIES: organic hydroperoxide resistance protein [Pseudomonas]MCX4221397.1 organic hydroperoxide resistance protein [Pseudomonas sp. MCal1]UIN53388.1 organic hydroperoxide resistance protein [Pseudomonas kribbensis]